jgi:hypothetical protein
MPAPGQFRPSAGDIRCIVYGHLTRMAVWRLRRGWDSTAPTLERLSRFRAALAALGDAQAIIDGLAHPVQPAAARSIPIVAQDIRENAVSF